MMPPQRADLESTAKDTAIIFHGDEKERLQAALQAAKIAQLTVRAVSVMCCALLCSEEWLPSRGRHEWVTHGGPQDASG